MNSFITTIGEFKNLETEEIVEILKSRNQEAEESIITSWYNLIKNIKSSSRFSILDDDLIIGLEFNVYVDNMSVDLFIYGSYSTKETMYILEAKQWNDDYITSNNFSIYREEETVLYPQVQIFKHKMAIKNYLNIGIILDNIYPSVYIEHASANGLKKLYDMVPSKYKDIPLYNNLDDFFNNIISSNLKKGTLTINDFLNIEYKPAHDIIDAMSDIIKEETSFILTEEQELALKEIEFALKSGKKVIEISGTAGSGKTAILINLYIKLLKNMDRNNLTPFFSSGGQNTHLYRSLYHSADNLFNWTYSLERILKKENGRAVVLIDEAQSNKNGLMARLIATGAYVIFGYDKKQVLNLENSFAEIDDVRKLDTYTNVKLNNSVRFNNSPVFAHNIEKLVYGSNTPYQPDSNYDFKVVFNLDDFKTELNKIKTKAHNNTIALSGLVSSDANVIADTCKDLFFLNWGNKKENDWIPYIKRKNYANEFDGKYWLGTWWLPGLDVDYNVVVVGSDATCTANGLEIDPTKSMLIRAVNSAINFTKIPESAKLSGVTSSLDKFIEFVTKPGNEAYYEEFKQNYTTVIRNNYYVSFTRGRKGCLIYFTKSNVTEL